MAESEQDGEFKIEESFIGMCAVFLFYGAVLIALSELSRLVFGAGPVILYGLSLGLVLFFMFSASLIEIDQIRELFKKDGVTHLAMMPVGVLLSAALFGLFCRELFLTGAQFTGDDGTHRLEWIGFGFDNLFEALFFDVPTIYELHLADIFPATFWTRLLLVTFRITIDVVLIRTLFKFWNVWREHCKSSQQNSSDESPKAT